MNPNNQIDRYLWVWFFVAIGRGAIALIEMAVRGKISGNRKVWQMHLALVGRVAPSLFVGFVYTLLIAAHSHRQPAGADTLMWTLPGVWSMTYSLGLFACHKHLPARTSPVAVYLLIVAQRWVRMPGSSDSERSPSKFRS